MLLFRLQFAIKTNSKRSDYNCVFFNFIGFVYQNHIISCSFMPSRAFLWDSRRLNHTSPFFLLCDTYFATALTWTLFFPRWKEFTWNQRYASIFRGILLDFQLFTIKKLFWSVLLLILWCCFIIFGENNITSLMVSNAHVPQLTVSFKPSVPTSSDEGLTLETSAL